MRYTIAQKLEDLKLLSEIAYNTGTRQLFVGNPKSEKCYDVVEKVYEGPNNYLYAKVENQDDLIPIGRLT